MAAPMKVKRMVPFKKLSSWQKTEISEVKKKAKEFLSDRKKANNVLEIVAVLETEDPAVAIAGMHALCTVFTAVVGRGEITLHTGTTKQVNSELQKTAEEMYRFWLGERYAETTANMLKFLISDQKYVQQVALACLLRLVQAESGHGPKFPAKRLKSIVSVLLSSSRDMKQLIMHYTEYLQYEDFKFHSLRIVHKRLENQDKLNNEMFLNNCFVLLEHVKPGSNTGDVKRDYTRFQESEKTKTAKDVDPEYVKMKKVFALAWLSFLRQKLNNSLHRRVLVILHEKVMPHIKHPLLLTDFLMDSYELGGPISLLALNGIFFLMQKHNLELPDFYKKLYALFEPGIFYTRYRARFFYLANIFLSSTHLPAYLVAAFAKRLARLSLAAPPNCLKLVIPFIRNLLIRHPSLDKMLHNPDGPQSWSSDPYVMDETNPAKCKAIESSLWELLALRQHYYPGVSMAASMVEKQLPTMESDISDLLELSMSDLVDGEAKRHKKDIVAVNFERPSGLLCSKGNMNELWTL